jgi:hypothetical protein
MKKLSLYMIRWQMSTPILSVSVYLLPGGTLFRAAAANLIGSLIFFPVDRWIMSGGIENKQNQ